MVDDVSLELNGGEIVGLLGANGAGKTTSFYLIVGLESAEAGQIVLNGEDVTRLPMYLRARLGLGADSTTARARLPSQRAGPRRR